MTRQSRPPFRVLVNQADLVPVSDALIERAVETALLAEEVPAAELAVTFLEDAPIRELNRTYLEHDWPTDVLSFPLTPDSDAPEGMVAGEVYVGAAQARAQALERDLPATEEAVRLVVHGTLHVLGYDHPDADREHSDFFVRQEALVASVLAESTS